MAQNIDKIDLNKFSVIDINTINLGVRPDTINYDYFLKIFSIDGIIKDKLIYSPDNYVIPLMLTGGTLHKYQKYKTKYLELKNKKN